MSARSKRAPARRFSMQTAAGWGSIAAVFVAGLIAIAIGHRSVDAASTQAPMLSFISAGADAPNFSVTTDQGDFTLDKTRKPTLLELFATWCPHCQHETVVMNRLFARFGSRVAFVAVTASPYASDRQSPESIQDVIGFEQAFNVHYPVAFDPSLSVARAYLQGGYPTIAIIERGKLRYITSGEVAYATLASALNAALKQ